MRDKITIKKLNNAAISSGDYFLKMVEEPNIMVNETIFTYLEETGKFELTITMDTSIFEE